MAFEEPCLQRLLNLEKNFSKVHDQLQEIRDILSLNERRSVKKYFSNHCRAKWAIRWLQKKTQSSEDVAADPHSWSLLHDILTSTDPSIALQTLDRQAFLLAVGKTLCNIFGEDDAKISRPPTPSSSNEQHPVAPEMPKDPSDASKKKKRKASDPLQRGNSKKQRVEEGSPLATRTSTLRYPNQLFTCIRRSLELLVSLAEHGSSDASMSERRAVKSTLTCDTPTAAMVLQGGLEALRFLHPKSSHIVPTVPNDKQPSYGLEAFAYIWETAVNSSSESSAKFSQTFAEYCLPSAASLLSLHGRYSTSPADRLARDKETQTITLVARLIARNILVPARVAYQDESVARIPSERETKDATDDSRLSDLLKPLKIHLSKTSTQELINEAIPRLFRLCLQYSATTSRKQRMQESPWIQHLFDAFGSVLGTDLDSPSLMLSYPTTLRLGYMLQYLVDYGRKISRPTLNKIVSHCFPAPETGTLELPWTGELQWKILALVLRMDANALIGSTSSQNNLSRVLTWIDSIGYVNWDHEVGNKGGTCHGIVVQGVILPLLRSYSSARQLPDFLRAWSSSLSKFWETDAMRDKSLNMCSYSYWECFEISKAASEALRSSLSNEQISDVLQSFTDDLNESEESNEKRNTAFICSAMVVVNAICLSLTDIEGVRFHSPTIVRIIDLSMSYVERSAKTRFDSRHAAWRLLSTSVCLWVRAADPITINSSANQNDLNRIKKLDMIPQIVQELLHKISISPCSWNLLQEALEALACLGMVVSKGKKRNLALLPSFSPDTLLDVLGSIFSSEDAGYIEPERFSFASIIAKFPFILPADFESKLPAKGHQNRISSYLQRLSQLKDGDTLLALKEPSACSAIRCKIKKPSLQSMDISSFLAPLETEFLADIKGEVSSELLTQSPSLGAWRQLYLMIKENDNSLEMSRVFDNSCYFLAEGSDIQRFKLISRMILDFLARKDIDISQPSVEALLTGLQTVVSSLSPDFDRYSAPKIYSRICAILRAILARSSHRKRLRGRTHLLMPLFQSLLRCFFTQSRFLSLRDPQNRIEHPKWLQNIHGEDVIPPLFPDPKDDYGDDDVLSHHHSKSERQSPEARNLTARQATEFTILLTSFCDPTPSSASSYAQSSKKHDNGPLTDATREARIYAGQHIGLVIGELCACLLKNGRYCNNGVKEALMPGVWAAFDTMNLVKVGRSGGKGKEFEEKTMLDMLGEELAGEMFDGTNSVGENGPQGEGGDVKEAGRSVLAGLVREWRRVNRRGEKGVT